MGRVHTVGVVVAAAISSGLIGYLAANLHADRTPLAKQIGIERGICAIVGDQGVQIALDLAKTTHMTLYVQVSTAKRAQAACRNADAAGLYGSRIFIAHGDGKHIGIADNLADVVIAPWGDVPEKEVLRVLRPGGKALLGDKQTTKGWPEGMDDWSHHYHGPDNNTQSKDQLARAPYLTQFIAEPRYGSAPQCAVASKGRLFMAFGHIAWHQREEAVLNTLIAVNAFNGTELWRRSLTQGIMVDRSTMIATPDTLYLADDKSCKLLDPATGELTNEITVPIGLTDGSFWKWIALEEGILYALIGKHEPSDPNAQWRAIRHGWPWNGISEGYNKDEYTWGFAKTLLAIDPVTKRVLWCHTGKEPIDSRALCMKNGRIYAACFGRYIVCLDASTGNVVWRRTAEDSPEVFKAIGPYRPGHGYIGGWKSTVYLRCTDEVLYVVGPQVKWLTALSAQDGHVLWTFPAQDLHIVIRDDGLYTIGPQGQTGQTKRLAPLSGAILANYDTHRRACTRSVGTVDGILFRATEGSVRLDLPSGKPQWISPMRPSCHIGVLVANGHLYWVPWACDCNLQMFGTICCGPAGDFEFAGEAPAEERIERNGRREPIAFNTLQNDWPTFRADNRRSSHTHASVTNDPQLLWQTTVSVDCELTAPVIAGATTWVGGSDGIVRALNVKTGRERWRAYTGGMVMYPPTIAKGRVFVGSGDGWVYALEAATGQLLWRFRAAPQERRINLYGTLISTWPAASGVLVEDDTAYVACGMMDYDGTHVYALDTATGRIKWQNHTAGHLDAFSRRGVACQGELLLDGERLYLAGGNAVSPGVFEAATGECLNVAPTSPGTQAPRGRELRLEGGEVKVSGQPLYSTPEYPVFNSSTQWGEQIVRAANADLVFREEGEVWKLVAYDKRNGAELWNLPLPSAPVRWGIAVDGAGRIVLSLSGGQVMCLG
ncbi:MAG: outer membrane protein assembly factor BamB family protein [Candidatus Zipacnadales bacterium]